MKGIKHRGSGIALVDKGHYWRKKERSAQPPTVPSGWLRFATLRYFLFEFRSLLCCLASFSDFHMFSFFSLSLGPLSSGVGVWLLHLPLLGLLICLADLPWQISLKRFVPNGVPAIPVIFQPPAEFTIRIKNPKLILDNLQRMTSHYREVTEAKQLFADHAICPSCQFCLDARVLLTSQCGVSYPSTWFP